MFPRRLRERDVDVDVEAVLDTFTEVAAVRLDDLPHTAQALGDGIHVLHQNVGGATSPKTNLTTQLEHVFHDLPLGH